MGKNIAVSVSPPFMRLYIVTFLFFSANPIINIVVPLRGKDEGASNGEIGMMMGAYMLTSMLLRPWAGNVVARFGPQFVLRLLLLANFIILALYSLLGLEWYFLLRALQGVTTAFFSLALQMGIVDTLPEKERSQGLSLYLLAGMLPTVVLPMAALYLWNWGELHTFAAAMLIIGIAAGFVGYSSPLPSRLASSSTGAKTSSTLAQLNQLWSNRAFLVCSIAMLIASIGFGAVVTFIALYTKQSGVGDAGIYLMIQAGIIVVSRFALRTKLPSDGKWPAGLTISLLLCMTIGTELLALSIDLGAAYMYVAAGLIGLGMALLYPTLMTYLTFVLPAASRNTLIGLFIAMSDLGVVLGNMAMGPVADHLSYSVMYSMCALLLLAAAAVVRISGRRLKSESR
ncbi:multidrug MFS transporter [Paenibacillus sp. BIHB 4019]|uniref:Multidrug MFS transporter n=1 Tax=Paenibacillus sp. BIHB 4019 TaxID=1870819 RepID=A0A1B2DKX7_9BACL|nr:MFS transporter [Paenibacillus sp. BIHB 4019]ANY68370.1 multidrug MFS transporter [Paenibacillus sp. BIHB 4019]